MWIYVHISYACTRIFSEHYILWVCVYAPPCVSLHLCVCVREFLMVVFYYYLLHSTAVFSLIFISYGAMSLRLYFILSFFLLLLLLIIIIIIRPTIYTWIICCMLIPFVHVYVSTHCKCTQAPALSRSLPLLIAHSRLCTWFFVAEINVDFTLYVCKSRIRYVHTNARTHAHMHIGNAL